MYAIPLELKVGWKSYFWMQIFWYTSQPAQNFWDSNLWTRNLITFATNLFMICPHHATFYEMQSDTKFHPSSAEWSDTEQKNNEALFSLQSNLLPVTCRSGMNSCQTLLFRPFWLKHSFFALAEGGPSPLPITAIQNSGNSSCYGQIFAVQEPNQYTGVGHADEVIQWTIYY